MPLVIVFEDGPEMDRMMRASAALRELDIPEGADPGVFAFETVSRQMGVRVTVARLPEHLACGVRALLQRGLPVNVA